MACGDERISGVQTLQTSLAHATAPQHQAVDSLAQPQLDSLQLAAQRAQRAQSYPYPVYCTAESLCDQPAYTRAPVYKDATPEEVFGATSTHVPPRMVPQDSSQSLTATVPYEGLVLLLTAAYAILLIRNLAEIKLLFKRTARESASTDRLSEESARGGFSRFLTLATSLGILYVGVLAVKYSDVFIPGSVIAVIPQWVVLSLTLLAAVVCLCVASYQTLVIRLSAAITLAHSFATQLLFVRRVYFSLGVVIIAPLLLLFALCPRGEGDVWFATILLLLALTLLMYLRETLSLFISQKISILHWFLYLCIVEIFPVSFLLLIAAR